MATIALAVGYLLYSPLKGPSGSSLYGYAVGILSAAGIIYLMLFGARKRAYYSSRSSLQGWLSAHVWLGMALVVWVPLHSAFEFGFNLHSLAYYLMLCTVVSGIWGAINYRTIPYETKSNRGSASLKLLLAQYEEAGQGIDRVCSEIKAGSSADSLKVRLEEILSNLNNAQILSPWRAAFRGQPPVHLNKELASQMLIALPEQELELGHRLISLIDARYDLVNLINDEIRATTLLKFWLYLHVPVACACVMAVIIHVVVVLFY